MLTIKPPGMNWPAGKNSVFLAGSIEMDTASPWQEVVIKTLGDSDADVVIYNPRRDEWDSSWKQEANDENFREQVEWELRSMFDVEIVAMYFDPATKSPITLLELGLLAGRAGLPQNASKSFIVCCPKGFWRKGNVDIVCEQYKIQMVETLEDLIKAIQDKLI